MGQHEQHLPSHTLRAGLLLGSFVTATLADHFHFSSSFFEEGVLARFPPRFTLVFGPFGMHASRQVELRFQNSSVGGKPLRVGLKVASPQKHIEASRCC